MITAQLVDWARVRNYQVAWAPATAIDEVRMELEARRASGEFDPVFARDQLSAFDFPSISLDQWRVVLIAMPRPAHRVGFTIRGQRVDLLLPPTYVSYRRIFADVRDDLRVHALVPARVETLNAPLKALAVKLGLARYGRNNLCYAPTFGSYMQLVGYLTDADLRVSADWRPHQPALLDECEDCVICEAVCPTGAIRDDRVLLHAEHCLTFINENAAPLPAWVPSTAHHTLIGCLQCQRHCPANADLPVEESGVSFSEEETAVLIGGSFFSSEHPEARRKLDRLALTDEHVIGRNLRAFLASSLPQA